MHGKGTLIYTYGDQFIGDWIDARKHGEGELIYSNGDRFRGQWIDDRASGFGVFAYANGNRYEGQWIDDKRHGRGQFICAQDGSTYDGEFANGRKEGRGLLKVGLWLWIAGMVDEEKNQSPISLVSSEEPRSVFQHCHHHLFSSPRCSASRAPPLSRGPDEHDYHLLLALHQSTVPPPI